MWDKIKKIIPIVLILLFIPIFISSALVVGKSTPAIKEDQVRAYITISEDVGRGKVDINWVDLVAIDAVRYKQDFKKATNSSIRKLADRFIREVKRTVKDKDGKTHEVTEYYLKSIDDVMSELGFTEDQVRDAKLYKEVGMGLTAGSGKGPNIGEVPDVGEVGTSMSQKEFIDKMSVGAKATQQKYGVFSSITMAQAILETGWGGSRLTRTDNNLFGIKFPGRHDPSLRISQGTWATDDGGYYAHYDSWEDSVIDHGYFIKNNSRYGQHGFFSSKDYIGQAYALKNAGYASDPNYAISLIQIVKMYKLDQYDK